MLKIEQKIIRILKVGNFFTIRMLVKTLTFIRVSPPSPVLSEPHSVYFYLPNLSPSALSLYESPKARVYCTLPRPRSANRGITAQDITH